MEKLLIEKKISVALFSDYLVQQFPTVLSCDLVITGCSVDICTRDRDFFFPDLSYLKICFRVLGGYILYFIFHIIFYQYFTRQKQEIEKN